MPRGEKIARVFHTPTYAVSRKLTADAEAAPADGFEGGERDTRPQAAQAELHGIAALTRP